MSEQLHRERHEGAPHNRLETYIIFVRHGESEKLPGMDTDETIDAARQHTPKGEGQVNKRGQELAGEFTLRPNDLVVKRSSPRVRARQTSTGVVDSFVAEQVKLGVEAAASLGNSRSIARQELNFGNASVTYAAGGRRRGSTTGLSEEWARNPAIFQGDIEASGLVDVASAKLHSMRTGYQNTLATVDRASSRLAERWAKKRTPDDQAPAPRLFVFQGAHGFVTEPWLKEVVAEHEGKTGKPVRLEMTYGENFTIHLPASPKESATLKISGETIPISPDHLKKL